jgi:hypothetical protein
MKLLTLALGLLAFAPSSFAADSFVCAVTAVSDPVARPNVFDKELINVKLDTDGTTHYVLLAKDLSAASEISGESYQQRKKDKRFDDIDGQAMAIFQREEDGLLYVTFGYISAEKGQLVNGSSAMGYGVKQAIANFPLDRLWAAGCRLAD